MDLETVEKKFREARFFGIAEDAEISDLGRPE
jgi:hypothetical protein